MFGSNFVLSSAAVVTAQPLNFLFCIGSIGSTLRHNIAVTADDGTDLGGGIVTRSNVNHYADFSLDLRDIEQSIRFGNKDAALHIYLNGKNSQIKNNNRSGSLCKLTELSQDLASPESIKKSTPPYLFHLYGLAGRSNDWNILSGYGSYADSYVRNSIQNGAQISSTAIIVLNVWMYAANSLYNGANVCQSRTDADNPSQFDVSGNVGLDDFIALWIGSGQTHGSAEGYSLYALAEKSDQLFNTLKGATATATTMKQNSLAESNVNQQIKLLFQEGASMFSIPDSCTKTNVETSKMYYSVITRIISQMHIPLIRMLIISILEKDTTATKLYATAVVPQAAQCRPSIFDRLKEELLDGEPNIQRTEFIIRDLQEIYSCFGIKCHDIGLVTKKYQLFTVPECITSNRDDKPMALYQPSTDVHSVRCILFA